MAVGWYVSKIQRGKETSLQSGLHQYGIEVYNPSILVVKGGRKRWEPLFPTYLFCLIDPESDLWPRIHWARGLRYFLGAEGRPTPVPSALVEEIMARVGRWNGGGWESVFEPGARVRIGDGTLTGLEAIFKCYMPGHQRCEVLISLMGRNHRVQLPITSVEALGPIAISG